MRRVILITLTLLVLVGAFIAFMWAQRGVRVVAEQQAPTPATRPSDDAQTGSFGRTRGIRLTMYDKEVTGLPKVLFRGEELVPQTGDQVLVQQPQVDFFIGRTRSEVVRVAGKTGLVIMPGEGPRLRSDLTPSRTQPPTRGEMRDVTVSYFPTLEAAQANQAEIVLTLPNAYFDSDRHEIATEEYTNAEGQRIAANEVPVKVRGESFDFDGYGLMIRWDDATQRLRSLVVHRGEQLVIKRPYDQLRERRGASRPVSGVQLAAADAATALQAAAGAAAQTASRIYRATFHDGVKVTQQDAQLATAQVMHVDFVDRGSPEPLAANAPAGPATAPRAPRAAAPAETAAAREQRQTMPGADPAQPVVIRWGGQLTVTPAPEEPLRPGSDDDAVIRLAGSEKEPARLFSEGNAIEAQWVAYRVEEQFAWVEGSENRPVRLTDADGSVLITPQLRFSQRDGVAILRGPSSAEVHAVEQGEKQTLNATWRDIAEARFTGTGKTRGISSLVLKGAVDVKHPRIREFQAGELAMEFAEREAGAKRTNASGQLKRLVATKDVNCVLLDERGELQRIVGQNLELMMDKTADGRAYPAKVVATGSVVAGNATEQIAAQRIQAELDPPVKSGASTRPAGVEYAGLRNLLAEGDVQLNSAKGEVVKGDRLQVRQARERNSWIMLEGKPASVAQDRTLLAGPIIELDTATQTAVVTGGGQLRMSESEVGGGKGQPMDVTWTGDGRLDGPKDLVTVMGNVQVRYVDADGAINEAASDRVEIQLGRKAAVSEAAKAPTTRPRDQRFAFMSDRFARQITMLPAEGREIRLQSLLPGPNNTILRQINLFGPRLDAYLVQDERGGSRIDRLVVPSTKERLGRMLYVELPAATRKPVATGDPLKTRNLPGATAFAWREQLVYDRATAQFTMSGGVMVRHEPALPAGKSFQIDAQTIVADVAGSDAPKTGPVPAMEVKKITLLGRPVHLVREDIELTAPRIEVDPTTSMVEVRSVEGAPVNVEKGRVTGTMRNVQINTKTNEIRFEGMQGTGRQ